MIPLRIREGREVLKATLMPLERDLRGLGDTSPHRYEGTVEKLNFEKENESVEKLLMLEEEEPRITTREQAEVQESTERRFAEIVSVLLAVLRQPDLCQYDVDSRREVDGSKYIRPVGI